MNSRVGLLRTIVDSLEKWLACWWGLAMSGSYVASRVIDFPYALFVWVGLRDMHDSHTKKVRSIS